MCEVFCNVQFCTFYMFLYVYDLFHILLSCDKIMDPWNICVYVRVCLEALNNSEQGFLLMKANKSLNNTFRKINVSFLVIPD
jgi:hypothetical protein